MGQIIISIIAVVVWVASFWIDTSVLGFSYTASVFTRLTYVVAHTSFFHLLMNLISLNLLMRVAKKIHLKYPLLVAYIASVIGTLFSTYAIPTVGLSGVCFALLGAILVKIHNKEFLISIGVVLVSQVITLFVTSKINVSLHLSSFIIGFLITYFLHYDKRTKKSRQGVCEKNKTVREEFTESVC